MKLSYCVFGCLLAGLAGGAAAEPLAYHGESTTFGGNDILALAAYNAGRGNVRDWMERWHWNNTFNEIEAIPYPETRLYVRRVLEDREQYKRLYEE